MIKDSLSTGEKIRTQSHPKSDWILRIHMRTPGYSNYTECNT